MWRSLVAHLTGGQGVAGSNPVIPTVFSQVSNLEPFGLAVAREDSAGNLRVRESFRAQQGGGAVLGLFGRGSPGPGDDRRCDDLPTGTARPDGEDLSMSVEQGATRAVRVDAHQHFWDPTTADYPWMSDAPDVVRRPYRPDDLTPILAAAHIDATVVVQARLDMDETRALLRTADEVDAVVGVVGWVDLIAGDVARSIAELRGAPGGARLVGLRHHANEEPDPRWLCRPDVIRGLRLAAQAGLCFDLLVWPRELPAALDLAAMVPEVRLVLDHMGKPAVRDGLDEGWAQAIRGLGALGNVSVKLSGIATEAADRWSVDDLRPFVDGPSVGGLGGDAGQLHAHVAQRAKTPDRLCPPLVETVAHGGLAHVVENEPHLRDHGREVKGRRQLTRPDEQVEAEPCLRSEPQPADDVRSAEPPRIGLLVGMVSEADQAGPTGPSAQLGDAPRDIPGGQVHPTDDAGHRVDLGGGPQQSAGLVQARHSLDDHRRVDACRREERCQVVRPVGSADDVGGVRHPRVVRGRRVPEVLVRVHSHRARRALLDAHAEILSGRTHGACREIIAPPVIPRPRRAAAEQLEGRTAEAERPSDAHQHCRDDRI